ncbi:hypothetical protein STENM36S_03781 [Streptomyces tendae]
MSGVVRVALVDDQACAGRLRALLDAEEGRGGRRGADGDPGVAPVRAQVRRRPHQMR